MPHSRLRALPARLPPQGRQTLQRARLGTHLVSTASEVQAEPADDRHTALAGAAAASAMLAAVVAMVSDDDDDRGSNYLLTC